MSKTEVKELKASLERMEAEWSRVLNVAEGLALERDTAREDLDQLRIILGRVMLAVDARANPEVLKVDALTRVEGVMRALDLLPQRSACLDGRTNHLPAATEERGSVVVHCERCALWLGVRSKLEEAFASIDEDVYADVMARHRPIGGAT